MKMNVSGQQLPTQLKLPIPRLHTTTTSLPTKFPEMLIPNNWSPNTSSQFQTTSPSTQQVVTCQQMLTTSSMGKSTPSKRGRKPLSRMPETKKHIQNLTNQRAFRRRREDYVRTLESKATTYELLYTEAQNDIKMLRDKLVLLERRLAKAQENNNDKCGGNTTIYQENDTSGDVSISNTYDDNRSITPNTMTPFSFNERYKQSSPPSSVESVEDIINNPVFCETKEGDLCFCESVEGDDIDKDQSQLSPASRYFIEQKGGKRMWIIPKQSVIAPYSTVNTCNDSRVCCPTLSSSEQTQWRQENYYTPSPSPIEPSTSNYTTHHPLNLKLILGNNDSDEESGDDSA